jgi:succinyl-CoA synthetase beta subunit
MKAERLDELKALKADIKAKLKGKKFGTLPSKEKDELLEAIAKMLGLIE